MDRFAQLAVAATLEAVEQADLKVNGNNSERVAVIISSGIGGIITLEEQVGVLNDRGASRISPFLVPMMLPDMASGQVSMLLGAKGPNSAPVSACSSGADAVGQALELVANGDADIALAGGSEAAICAIGIAGFNACKALSRHNHEPAEGVPAVRREAGRLCPGRGGRYARAGDGPERGRTGHRAYRRACRIRRDGGCPSHYAAGPGGRGRRQGHADSPGQRRAQARRDRLHKRPRHVHPTQRQVRDDGHEVGFWGRTHTKSRSAPPNR